MCGSQEQKKDKGITKAQEPTETLKQQGSAEAPGTHRVPNTGLRDGGPGSEAPAGTKGPLCAARGKQERWNGTLRWRKPCHTPEAM